MKYPFERIAQVIHGFLDVLVLHDFLSDLLQSLLSDFLNIASREVSGLEYTATYVWNTADWGRFTFVAQANQFLKFDQQNAPGLPKVSYLGKFVSTVGDPISPGSIRRNIA